MHKGLKAIAIDPTHDAVLTVSVDRTAQMWSLHDGKLLDISFSHGGDLTSAEFSNDGGSLLTCSADGAARLWKRSDHRQVSHIAEVPSVGIVTSTPDGQWVLAWGPANTGNVFRASARDLLYPILKHDEPATAACISPDGQKVAAVDNRGNAIVWRRETGETLAIWSLHDQTAGAISFAPDSNSVVTGDAMGNVNLYNLDTRQFVQSYRIPGAVIELVFSANGELLLVSGSKATRLIQLAREEEWDINPTELDGDVRGARFSPDGQFIVIYGTGKRVLVRDIIRGSLNVLRTNAPVSKVCFTHDSSKVLTMAQDGTAQMWRLIDGASEHHPIQHTTSLTTGAISPDGRSVVLCGDDCTARVYRIADGQPITISLHHTGRIMHAQFVADQQLLTVTEGADLYLTNLAPSAKNIEQIENISMVRTGQHVDSAGVLAPLTRPELLRRYHAIDR